MISAIVVGTLGFSASPALTATSTCEDNGTVKVCVEWSSAVAPVEGDNFSLTFNGAAGVDLELLSSDLEWRLWTTLVSNGDVTSLGDITLNPDGNSDNFAVQIWGDGEAGAVDVGSLNLDGTINNASWVGYSSIRSGVLSRISGDVNGAIKLTKSSGGDGGDLGFMLIEGDVAGQITAATLSGSVTIGYLGSGGDVNGGFQIDELDGVLTITGTLPTGKTGEIGDITSGAFTIDTVALNATLDLLEGAPAGTGGVYAITNLNGELDLHSKTVAGLLFLGGAASTGTVVNGAAVTGVFLRLR
jgi:hypothetical protein